MYKIKSFGFVKAFWFLLSLFLFFAESIEAQPSVVTQPHDTAICVESSAHFDIIAVNTSAYQWQENDGVGWYDLTAGITYVSGQFTPHLQIIDANLGLNQYKYRCVVSDNNGLSDTSDYAVLGVYEPPVITQDPLEQTVCKNEIALFSTEATNGTDYQWQENSGIGWLDLIDNSFYSGTQTPDLSVYTTTGMDGFYYRCIIKHVSCPDTTLSAVLHVSPTPIVFSVTGGGEYCEGGNGVVIGLSGSEAGISYNLVLDGVQTGIVAEGTGNPLEFSDVQQPGIYTIEGYNSFSGCTIEMSGQAIVEVDSMPADFEVHGGGEMCQGDQGLDVFLLSSEQDIVYDLYLNGQQTGNSVTGTGYTISFGLQTQEGYYTVTATNPLTGCSRQMSGSAHVIVNEIPVADAGDDKFVTQGDMAQLNGNATGGSGNYQYSWQPEALCVLPQSQHTGTIPMYVSTMFTLTVNDNITGCGGTADSTIVYVSSGPLTAQALVNKSAVCAGESIQLLAVAGGGTGNYSYVWTSSPAGFSSVLRNPVATPQTSTVYLLEITDGVETVYDSVSVNVSQPPLAYNVSGGGVFCEGSNGSAIQLSGSQQGKNYSLFRNQVLEKEMTGTGQPLNFGTYNKGGNYHVVAVDFASGCERPQNDTVFIASVPLPVADAGPDVLITTGQNATLTGSATGGSGGGYTYSWTPSDSLLNPMSASPATVPLHRTNLFYLTVTDGNGCSSVPDDAIVFVSGGVIGINIAASPYPKCPGEEVQLFALASGGSGSYSYSWQSNPAGFSSTIYNPIVHPQQNTWYKVTVNDGFGSVSDSIYITVNPAPLSFSVGGGGTVCRGEMPQNITLSGSEQNVEYNLLKNGLSVGYGITGTGYPLDFGSWTQNGTYTVEAENNYSQCKAAMAGSATVLINERPSANAGTDQTITSGTSATLTGTATGGSGSYGFLWQPAALCQNPLNKNTETNVLTQTTLFSLTVTDNQTQCVSFPDTVIIYTNNGNLYANATAETGVICSNESVSLEGFAGGGTGNYNYSWTSSPPGFYSQNRITVAQPQVNTYYILDVFDGLNHAFDSVYVQVQSAPALFNITGGGAYCSGGDAPFIGLSGSQNGVQYTLYKQPGIDMKVFPGTGQPFDFGRFDQQGTYYAVGINQAGCQSNMVGETTVELNMPPLPNAGQDKSVTYNSQALLEGSATGGSGNYTFDWTPADSLMNASDPNAVTKPLHKTNIFHLEVTDAATGCGGLTDQTIVFVSGGALTLDISVSQATLCPGDSTQLFALASGGSGNYTFLWVSEPAGFVSTQYNPFVSPQQTTMYKVTLNDGTTILSDSVTVTVNPLPQRFSLTGGGTVCENTNPQNIVLQSSEQQTDYYLLKEGIPTGLVKSGNGYALDFGVWTDNGNYSVTATNNVSLCQNSMANSVQVTINPLPVADAGPDVSILSGESTVLTGAAGGGSGSYSYQWQPSYLCLTPLNQNTQTHPLGQSTIFTLLVNDLQTQCTSLPDTVIVYTNSGDLTVNVTASPGTVCLSESVSLYALPSGGSGNYSYTWTSSPPGFYSQQANVRAVPQVSTMYYVDVFDGLNHASDSVYVVVEQNPAIFNITGGGGYCEGADGPAINLSGSENGITYKLYRDPGQFVLQYAGDGQPFSFGNFLDEGTYYAVAVNSHGCTGNMAGSVNVVKYHLPVAYAGENQTIEAGQFTTLYGSASNGSGNYQYHWSPVDSLLNPNDKNAVTRSLYRTNVFNLSVADAVTGCQGIDDQTVVFVEGGDFSITVQQSAWSVCPGDDVQLFVIASGGSGSYSYDWSSIPPGLSSNVYNPIVSPSVTTVYTVTVSDGNNTMTDSITVEVNPLPVTYQLSGGGIVCQGDNPGDIVLSGSETGVSYELLKDGLQTGITEQGTGFDINFGTHLSQGSYTVIGVNDTTGCLHDMAGSAIVQYRDKPVSNAGPDMSVGENESAILQGSAAGGSGAYSYNWNPGALCITPANQTTQTHPLQQTTLFTLDVDDLQTQCSSESDTTIVYVTGTTLSAQAGADKTSLCLNESVSLLVLATGGTGTYSYMWTSQPKGFVSNLMNPSAMPVTTTTYYVDVFDGLNHAYDSVTVEVTPLPQPFAITGGGAICEGDNGVVIGLNGSEQNVNYSLYNAGGTFVQGVTGNGQPIDFGLFSQQGTYYAVAENNGCTLNMNGEATVTVNEIPIVNAGNDVTVQFGNSVTLNGSATRGSGIYTFTWTPADSLVNPNTNQPLTHPMHKTTLFTAHAVDFLTGCEGLPDQTVVFVSGGPLTVDIYPTLNNLCSGETSQLFAMASGGSGNYQYSWVSEPVGFYSNIYNPEVNPQVTTKYKVLINDGNEIITDSITINVNPSPEEYLLQGGGAYCEGGNGVEITLSGSESGVSYELISSEGTTGLTIPGNGSPLNFGYQTIEAAYWVYARNLTDGCTAYMNDTVFVNINENPQVSAGPDRYIQSGNSATLNGSAVGGSGNYAFLWSPENLLQDPAMQNATTIPLEQSAIFLLNATDVQTGCVSNSDSAIVFVTDGPLSVNVTANPAEVCCGQPVQLNVLASGGGGVYSYEWTSNPEGFYSSVANPLVFPVSTVWYRVTVSVADNSVTDSVLVTVHPQPSVFGIAGGGELCQGGEGVEIRLSGSEQNVRYYLYRNQNTIVTSVDGTGNELTFGTFVNQGTYTAKAQNLETGCGQPMNGSALVVVNELPVANAGEDAVINQGESLTLHGNASGGSGSYDYQWTPTGKLLNPTQKEPTTLPLNSTVLFSLNVTDAVTGCKNREGDDVVVFVTGQSSLTVEAFADRESVCQGGEVKLTALPTGGNGNYTYLWISEPPGLTATTRSVKVYPETGTEYIVNVISEGIAAKDSVTVNIFDNPGIFNVEGGGGYCPDEQGADISLSGSETGTAYTLFLNNNNTGKRKQGNGTALDFGFLKPEGTYTVTAVNQNKCKAVMNGAAEVVRYDKPKKFQVIGGGDFCDNDPVLGILLESSEKDVEYKLFADNIFTGISLQGTGLPLSFTGLTHSGIYTVEGAKILTGCTNGMNGAAQMIIRNAPVVTITGDTSLCSGFSTTLTASGGNSYLWNTTPQQTTPSITVTPEQSTLYTVWVGNTQGCATVANHSITVYETPQLSVENNTSNYSLLCYPGDLPFYRFFTGNAVLQEGQSNELYYGDLSLNADTVYVMAQNANGCSDTVSVFVEFSPPPNAFTPDGDGKNDIFMEGRYIIVYNRWGKEIFKGDEGWNGKYNGKPVTPGTYYYVQPIYDNSGNIIENKKGSVTVVVK